MFARRVFAAAGIYGLIVLLPQYFLEDAIGRLDPPPITHPEHFYGFLGVALAWQVAFLIIARDPPRFRPMMLAAILEKLPFVIAATALYARDRVSATVLFFAGIDLLLAALFLAAYLSTNRSTAPKGEYREAS